MVWVGLSIWMRILASAGRCVAPASASASNVTAKSRRVFIPDDFPQGLSEQPLGRQFSNSKGPRQPPCRGSAPARIERELELIFPAE